MLKGHEALTRLPAKISLKVIVPNLEDFCCKLFSRESPCGIAWPAHPSKEASFDPKVYKYHLLWAIWTARGHCQRPVGHASIPPSKQAPRSRHSPVGRPSAARRQTSPYIQTCPWEEEIGGKPSCTQLQSQGLGHLTEPREIPCHRWVLGGMYTFLNATFLPLDSLPYEVTTVVRGF